MGLKVCYILCVGSSVLINLQCKSFQWGVHVSDRTEFNLKTALYQIPSSHAHLHTGVIGQYTMLNRVDVLKCLSLVLIDT